MHFPRVFKWLNLKRSPQFSMTGAVTVFVLVVCSTVIGVDSWTRLDARDARLREAESTTHNLARGLAQHAGDTLRAADVVLTELVERRESAVQAAMQQDDRLQSVLQQRAAGLPFLSALSIIDAQGWMRLMSSGKTGENPLYVADREFFRFHSSNSDRKAHVGEMIRDRSTGESIITLSRRIDHADGSFAGVAVASIGMPYFQKYYASIDIGKQGEIALALRDGTVLVRRPQLEVKAGIILSNTPLWSQRKDDARFGAVTAESPLDGVERLSAYAKLEEYPLTVFAGLSTREILAEWWKGDYLHIAFVILLTVLLALVGLRLVRQVRSRTHGESALQSSERSWPYALEGIGDGLWEWNHRTGEVLYSRQWKAMLGYAENDIDSNINERQKLVHPDDMQAATEAFDAYASGKASAYAAELRMLCKDQSWRWILSRGMIIEQDADGRPLRTIGTHTDITERKLMEQALTASEERFRLIVEEVRDYAIVMLDANGNIITWNRGAQRIHGYAEEEIIGKNFACFYTAEEFQHGPPKYPLEIAQRHKKFVDEGWRMRQDGSTFFASVTITAVRNDAQKLIGFAKLTRDISESRMLEKELRDSEIFVRATIDALSAQICVLDENGMIIAVNQAWRDFHQVTQPGNLRHGIGTRYEILCDPKAEVPVDAARELALGINATMRGEGKAFEFEYPYQTADGQRWFRVKVTRLSGDVPKVVLAHENITELKLAEADLRFSSTVYLALGEAIMVLDEHNAIVAINPAFTRFTGYAEPAIIGQSMYSLQAHQPQIDFNHRMQQLLSKTGHWQGQILIRKQDGSIVPSWLRLDTIYDDDGRVRQRVGMYSRVTDHKLAEQTIWEQANFDALTGLPNRSMFQDRLDQELRKARRHDVQLAVLFIDLDRFKDINDTMGHDVGDVLLKETAQRLLSCVRAADTVARLGGDEFTVILSDLTSAANAARIAQDILQKMTLPFQLGSETAFISASIGITLYPEDGERIDALLKNADQAMYAAKNQGRNRYKFFTSSMQEAAHARMRLVNDLRGALANGQFRIVYQPIVNLSTGMIGKAEALIRWQHPERGLVNPVDFISLAEETGMIVDIGNWVFAEVTQQVKRWRALYDATLQISVNISPAQFRSDRHSSWLDYLQLMDVPGPCIGVEITEGMLMDASGPVTSQLHQFREAGMQVSLDDFGTGYSSLSYLKKFDIDTLKIDQSFVRNMTPGSDDLALCEAIIVMAHKLGIQVVAEGVETPEQRNMLASAGCDFGQGFYFSHPVSSEEFGQLWQQRCEGELETVD